jgi:hypothetical protein
MVGTKLDVINTAVNTSTDTEITYTVPIISFVMRTRNSNQFQWRPTDGAASFFSFDAGEKFESKVLLMTANYASASLGFIRTVGSDDTIEVIVSYLGAIK